jgi:ATP-dependent RNA helicase RhlE
MKFSELPLHPVLLAAVAKKGYETATPIQEATMAPVLAGHDLVGCAQTGTGKTAAFALPTLHRMLESIARQKAAATETPDPTRTSTRSPKSRRKTRTLVLAPTRELCSQITDSFVAYGAGTPLRYTVIFGGVSQQSQVRALQHGVDVIIATPGRLLDLMEQGHVDLTNVETLILDEADRMLDMGFIQDLKRIVARVPQKRQTLMFSATMPPEIRDLAAQWLVDPVNVAVTPVASTVERIDQLVYFVDKGNKAKLLRHWIERTASTRTLVFARTKHGADKIVKELLKSRIFAAAIHGNKSQSQREKALAQFKSTRPPVLVATDIAARGIDVTGISHVINFDLPNEPETYVHRIGRTGRAGADGIAVSFCSIDEVGHLRAIERLTRRRIDPAADHAEYPMAGQIAVAGPIGEERGGRPQQRRGNFRGGRPSGGRPSGGRPSGNRSGSGAPSGGRPKSRTSGSLPASREGGEQGTRIARPARPARDNGDQGTRTVERPAKPRPSQQTGNGASAEGRPPRRRRRPQGGKPGGAGRPPR